MCEVIVLSLHPLPKALSERSVDVVKRGKTEVKEFMLNMFSLSNCAAVLNWTLTSTKFWHLQFFGGGGWEGVGVDVKNLIIEA